MLLIYNEGGISIGEYIRCSFELVVAWRYDSHQPIAYTDSRETVLHCLNWIARRLTANIHTQDVSVNIAYFPKWLPN